MALNFDQDIYFALAKVYLKALQDNTPKKTGLTAMSWDLVNNHDGSFSLVNPYGNIVLFLEEGTRPHFIRPKTKKALRFKIGNLEVFAKEVKHPGFKGRKFLRSIFENESNYQEFERILWSRIEAKIQKEFS